MLNKYLPNFYPISETSISIIKELETNITLGTNSSKPTQFEFNRRLFLVWKYIINKIIYPVIISENRMLSTQIPSEQNKIVLQPHLYSVKFQYG